MCSRLLAKNKGLVEDNLEDFQNKKYGLRIWLCKKAQSGVAKRANTIITPSYYLKSIVKRWGAADNKIKVVYNAVEKSAKIDLRKEQAQNKINILGSIILSIGRLSPWKGFGALIEIMPDLLKQESNFKLVIVGDGVEMVNLKSQIANLKIENKIILTGRVSHSQIPIYLKAAEMFALNSQYEGLPHVLLEAMQAGVPIIASNKGGNPEVIEHNKNGLLIEYNNKAQLKQAILTLRRYPELKNKFIQNSQAKLQKFSYIQMIESTLNILTNA